MSDHPRSSPGIDHLRILQIIRDCELKLSVSFFPRAESSRLVRVLELGAGTGQQARQLQDWGYEVMAIDVPTSAYRTRRVFPVTEYDGGHIPAPDGYFDVVFSSNVLEHVVDLSALLRETRRVLRSGGLSVHLMPTPSNRLWSIPSHYIWLARRLAARGATAVGSRAAPDEAPRTPSSISQWARTLFPTRHGERGNVLTETYYFSRNWWTRMFEVSGFRVERVVDNGMFYTMSNAIGTHLSISHRRSLASLLGSACAVYVLRNASD